MTDNLIVQCNSDFDLSNRKGYTSIQQTGSTSLALVNSNAISNVNVKLNLGDNTFVI